MERPRLSLFRATAMGFALLGFGPMRAAPPYSGTVFLDPDILTATDPTTFQSVVGAGRGVRRMFDRRVNDWVNLNAFLFEAHFGDSPTVEIQVNPEFGEADAAEKEASKYAPVIGRLPACLRTDVQTVWIHRGKELFGGGNNNLLIHVEQAEEYSATGVLEEALIHEATHTSLDTAHAGAAEWIAAQTSDGEFISIYSRDHPNREDVAESFLPYLAVRHRAERLPQAMVDTISLTISNRLGYFDRQHLALNPMVPSGLLTLTVFGYDAATARVNLTWTSRAGESYVVDASADLRDWEPIVGSVLSQGAASSLVFTNTQPQAGAFFRVRTEAR